MATGEKQKKGKEKEKSSPSSKSGPMSKNKSTKKVPGRPHAMEKGVKNIADKRGTRKVSSSIGHERITLEPGKRSGQPCIRGLRVTVADILDYLATGMSIDEILADFPSLEREDILAALAFAASRERAIVTVAK